MRAKNEKGDSAAHWASLAPVAIEDAVLMSEEGKATLLWNQRRSAALHQELAKVAQELVLDFCLLVRW